KRASDLCPRSKRSERSRAEGRMRGGAMRRGGRARTALLLGVAGLALPSTAWAVDVASEAALRAAIFAANTGGDSTINIVGNITLTRSLPMITSSVTVNGGGNTVDADNQGRVFFVQAGTADISNVT